MRARALKSVWETDAGAAGILAAMKGAVLSMLSGRLVVLRCWQERPLLWWCGVAAELL